MNCSLDLEDFVKKLELGKFIHEMKRDPITAEKITEYIFSKEDCNFENFTDRFEKVKITEIWEAVQPNGVIYKSLTQTAVIQTGNQSSGDSPLESPSGMSISVLALAAVLAIGVGVGIIALYKKRQKQNSTNAPRDTKSPHPTTKQSLCNLTAIVSWSDSSELGTGELSREYVALLGRYVQYARVGSILEPGILLTEHQETDCLSKGLYLIEISGAIKRDINNILDFQRAMKGEKVEITKIIPVEQLSQIETSEFTCF